MSPFIKEELYGGEGLPPENNNQAVSPDNSGEWDRESLLMVPSDSHRVYSVDFPGKTRCLGSTAYHVGMVVDGRAKGALLGRVHIWDLAGAWAAATESDIRLVDVNGNDPDWSGLLNGNRSETPLLVTNRADCDELVDRINYQ